MSNRIDLTQFEDIREDWLYQEVNDPGNSEYATVNGGEFHDILFFIEKAEISEAELTALAMVPDLIAELKRCYELIDAQKENLEFLNGAIEKLHEETWTEAVVELVEEHHPSEWCDYSHCWKCEEEPTSE